MHTSICIPTNMLITCCSFQSFKRGILSGTDIIPNLIKNLIFGKLLTITFAIIYSSTQQILISTTRGELHGCCNVIPLYLGSYLPLNHKHSCLSSPLQPRSMWPSLSFSLVQSMGKNIKIFWQNNRDISRS